MTEQEIVKILKENKIKGIAYFFLPEETWNWIQENFNNPNLIYLAPNGDWLYFKDADFDDYDNIVFALPDMFNLPPKPQSGWEEFEINQRGQFLVLFTQDLRYYFNWFEWWRLLDKSIDYNYGFTAFGGWQYDDSKRWYLAPAVKLQDGKMWNSYIIEEKGEATPAIPKKIRFWRETR